MEGGREGEEEVGSEGSSWDVYWRPPRPLVTPRLWCPKEKVERARAGHPEDKGVATCPGAGRAASEKGEEGVTTRAGAVRQWACFERLL